MAAKMVNIDEEVKSWCFFRFSRSGDLVNLQEMDPAVREETVRSIRMVPLSGTAYDAEMNAVGTNGSVKQDSPGDDLRHYTKDELTAFNIKFLQTLVEKRGIKLPKSAGPDKVITAILEWQGGVTPPNTDTE